MASIVLSLGSVFQLAHQNCFSSVAIKFYEQKKKHQYKIAQTIIKI